MENQDVYLGILDRQMEGYFSFQDWERHLLEGLLFERRLVVPDTFFFISGYLESHVDNAERRGQRPLFEAAVSRGLIVPAFRRQDSSFADILAVVRKQKIVGIRPQADTMAVRLDNALNRSSASPPAHLPITDFGSLATRVLAPDAFDESLSRLIPPGDIGGSRPLLTVEELWERSKPWRQTALERAIIRSASRGDGSPDLRRGDWMSEAGWMMGWPAKTEVHDVQDAVKCLPDSRDRAAAFHFFRWMSECYQACGAMKMNLLPGFPGCDPRSAVVANSLIPSDSFASEVYVELPIEVEIPPTHVLLQLASDSLLDARLDVGEEYLTALDLWRNQPSDSTRNSLERFARAYARHLCSLAREKKPLLTRLQIRLTRDRSQEAIDQIGRRAHAIAAAAGAIGALHGVHDLANAALMHAESLPFIGGLVGGLVSFGSLKLAWTEYRYHDTKERVYSKVLFTRRQFGPTSDADGRRSPPA